MPNLSRTNGINKIHQLVCLALISVLLPACASTAEPGDGGSTLPAPTAQTPELAEAYAAWSRGDYAAASQAYERGARAQPPDRAAEYWLSAAEAAVAGRDADRALQLVGNIAANVLDPERYGRLQIVRAESLLLKNQPYEAVKALPPSSAHLPKLAGRIEDLRAKALFASGEAAPTPVVAAAPADAVNAGGTALLLPLTGSFAATAEAVRDGFLAAHFRNGASGKLRIYDVGSSNDNTLNAYRLAVAEGAATVVGPLRKEGVSAMAMMGTPAVPVLALNYLDETQPAPPRFFQFGLAPEDEARAAAEHAAGQGLRNAVALVPQADWGERAYNAFRQRLEAQGGRVVAVARYQPGQKDFSGIVRAMLHAQKPSDEKLPPGAVEPPRRRQDIDMVFVVARPLEGRLIGPMLRFYYAGDLPAYATAQLYDGRPDSDTAGIRFCDMPWMLSGEAYAAERSEAAELASQKRYPRLFAFGYDAQALVTTMRPGTSSASLSRMPGMTGLLSIDGNGAVRRSLQCAEIQGDRIQLLETPLAASFAP